MSGQAGVIFILAAAALTGSWTAGRWHYMVPSSPHKEAERVHRRNMQNALIGALLFLGVSLVIIGVVAL